MYRLIFIYIYLKSVARFSDLCSSKKMCHCFYCVILHGDISIHNRYHIYLSVTSNQSEKVAHECAEYAICANQTYIGKKIIQKHTRKTDKKLLFNCVRVCSFKVLHCLSTSTQVITMCIEGKNQVTPSKM